MTGRIDKSLTALGAAITSLIGAPALAQESGTSQVRAVAAEATAAAVTDPSWEVPRTSWGHPSLEGVWSTDDMRGVPTSRPPQFGTRASLTEEEFRERAERDEAALGRAVDQEAFLRSERGVRTFGYTSLVIDPADGRIPDMTPAAMARAGNRDRGTFGPGPFNHFEDFTLYDRCITRGIIGSALPVLYGNGIRIVQNPDHVAINYEMIHDTRIIPLDGRPHLDDDIRLYMGNARGYWDGETLVVETGNLTDKTSIGANGNGTRHSDQMKITERFTRVDPDMIEYVATVDDPVAYTAPFTFRMMYTTQPDYQVYEYSCHEGNGAVVYSLSGERAYERQVEEALAQGLPPPERSGNIMGSPPEGAEVLEIGRAQ